MLGIPPETPILVAVYLVTAFWLRFPVGVYVLAGFLAGIIVGSRLESAQPTAGAADLLGVIAVVMAATHDSCTWMFGQIGNGGNIAILTGVLGAIAQLQRSQGCQKALAEHPDVHLVTQHTANRDETEAYEAAQNILTAHANLEGVLGETDAMAMGAPKAAKQAGRTGLTVVGIDGFPTMFRATATGLTRATMAQRPCQMGRTAMRDVIALMDGKGTDIPANQFVPARLVDQGDIARYEPADFHGLRTGAG